MSATPEERILVGWLDILLFRFLESAGLSSFLRFFSLSATCSFTYTD